MAGGWAAGGERLVRLQCRLLGWLHGAVVVCSMYQCNIAATPVHVMATAAVEPKAFGPCRCRRALQPVWIISFMQSVHAALLHGLLMRLVVTGDSWHSHANLRTDCRQPTNPMTATNIMKLKQTAHQGPCNCFEHFNASGATQALYRLFSNSVHLAEVAAVPTQAENN